MKILIKDWTELKVEKNNINNLDIRYQIYLNEKDIAVLSILSRSGEIYKIELKNWYLLNEGSINKIIQSRIEEVELN